MIRGLRLSFTYFFHNKAKNISDKGTCKKQLPEERNREIEGSSLKPFLKRIVAAKLMMGHIRQTDMDEIASISMIGESFPGVTNLNARIFESFPTIRSSTITAIGHMISISEKAARKTKFLRPPTLSEML